MENMFQRLLNPDWQSMAFWGFLLISVMVLSSVIEVVYRSRTPQSAMAWSMTLVFMPLIGLMLYLLFGRRKFKGYKRARDLNCEEMNHLAQQSMSALEPYLVNKQKPEALETILEMPFIQGNEVRLLINAQNTYTAIFNAIDDAQHTIMLAYYLIRDDDIGQKLREKLVNKAQQGVKVYFIYDEIGSWQLAENYTRSLKNAGVKVQPFNTRQGFSNRLQLNFRNHRKLVVIDGAVAFAGGINMGEEYLGKNKRLAPWRDTHIKVKGPGALCAQLIFLEDWFWAAGTIPQLPPYQPISEEANVELLLMATGPADNNLEACTQAYSYLFAQAKKRIWITSPYFIPNQEVMNSLNIAAISGVDVRVIMPKKTDGILVKLSSFSFMLDALKNGVQIWRYKGFMHQKALLIDDCLAAIGSVNLDNRSFRLNFEANVLVRDACFARQVASMLEEDFSNSEAMVYSKEEQRSVVFKFLTKAARLLAPLQ